MSENGQELIIAFFEGIRNKYFNGQQGIYYMHSITESGAYTSTLNGALANSDQPISKRVYCTSQSPK